MGGSITLYVVIIVVLDTVAGLMVGIVPRIEPPLFYLFFCAVETAELLNYVMHGDCAII